MHSIARRWLRSGEITGEREFFRVWTRHEAVVKALGVGLSGSAEGFTGFVAEVDTGAGYAAAVAVMAPDCRVVVRDWPPNPASRTGR